MSKPDNLIPLYDDKYENTETFDQEYCGNYDPDGFRTGQGCHVSLDGYYEKYQGNFVLDNMHGSGVYIVKAGKQRTICSGEFYLNNLEGYAELIYPKGIFEGLFRCNRRFGPGILTYGDGSQDVGLWFDRTLIRLSCVILPHWMPILGRTAAAKAYLLQFHKLIPVIPEIKEDKAEKILQTLNANEEVLKMAHTLYNPHMRNRNSRFFNKNVYDKIFFGTEDCYIEVSVIETDAATQEESECDCNTKREEILKEIAIVDNMLYDLLEKYRKGEVEISDSTDAIHALKTQSNVLINFRERLRSKLTEDKEKSEKPIPTTKVLVTELLAWNNEKIYIKMLQHCFLHKNTEKNVSFDVPKVIAGERLAFERAGKHERVCIEFLTKCSEGKAYDIAEFLRKYNLNPDLCDANGNTGITFAVARDKLLVIEELANSGANLDATNDEGLTPLNLCMARYLAVQYDINDWERAFLPEMDRADEEIFERYSLAESHRVSFSVEGNAKSLLESPKSDSSEDLVHKRKSILSSELFADIIDLSEQDLEAVQSESLMDISENFKTLNISPELQEFQQPYLHRSDKKQTYIFNTACVRLMEKPTLKEIREAGSRKSSTNLKEKGEGKQDDENTVDEKLATADKLEVVRQTMLCLLHYGSNPDVGHVPFPALVMSVFTQNAGIVEQLLENNADPNITTVGENMTALHTVASLQPSKQLVEVGNVLLRYKANPNCRASPTHWLLLNASILGHGFENELPDNGKTPLHLLCMRYDFISDRADYFQNLAKLLLNNGANGNDMFLGHSPLSLAVVRGNIRLVETLLNTGCVDPNQKLGRGMGVPLTVLILKRYADVLYFDVCKVILDTLLEGRANPFEPIFDYGNAIDFMQRKHETRLTAERQQAQKQIESEDVVEKSSKAKKSKEKEEGEQEDSTVSGKKKGKVSDQVLMQNYLLERSREVLFKRIQCQATKLLYRFMDEYIPVSDVIELVQYLTPEDVCSNIELLLREGEMSFEDLHFDTLYRLTHYVANITKQRNQKMKDISSAEIVSTRSDYIQTAQQTLDALQAMDINETQKFQGAVHPSLDPDEDKYVVCFYCCRKKGRELYRCPKCEAIYFCSELCNKLCNKSRLRHTCGLLFYKSQKAVHEQIKTEELKLCPSKLSQKLSIVQSKKSERDTLKQDKEQRHRKINIITEEKRQQSSICQWKLEKYVEIMKKHIEKLELLEEDDTTSVMSLTQVAKDLTEIVMQADSPTSNQNLAFGIMKRFSVMVLDGDTSALKCESKKLLNELETQKQKLTADSTKLNTIVFQSETTENQSLINDRSVEYRRESIPFTISTLDDITSTQDQSFQTNCSKTFTIEGSNSVDTDIIIKKKRNDLQRISASLEPIKVIYKNEITIHTCKQRPTSAVSKPNIRRKKKLRTPSSKQEAHISSKSKTNATPIKTQISKPVSGNSTPKDQNTNLQPETTLAEQKSEEEEDRKSDDRLANYWFHKPLIKKLAKLFPTLNIPKLLFPFACFAEGEFYYRFAGRGRIVYTNYSKV